MPPRLSTNTIRSGVDPGNIDNVLVAPIHAVQRPRSRSRKQTFPIRAYCTNFARHLGQFWINCLACAKLRCEMEHDSGGDRRLRQDVHGRPICQAHVAELTAAGATKVFHETMSGAVTDRAALKHAVGSVEAGDVLLVTRLDRLARSPRDLLNTLNEVSNRRAGFRSLRDAWADTTTPHGRLMVTILARIGRVRA